jgi:prevent-host-death family protein
MRLSEDIKPISYVKANTGKVLEQVNTSGPMVITQNGEASAVLMGVKNYEQLQESLALLKILSMGSKSIEEGKGIPAEEAFARIRARIKEAKANG